MWTTDFFKLLSVYTSLLNLKYQHSSSLHRFSDLIWLRNTSSADCLNRSNTEVQHPPPPPQFFSLWAFVIFSIFEYSEFFLNTSYLFKNHFYLLILKWFLLLCKWNKSAKTLVLSYPLPKMKTKIVVNEILV